MWNKKSIFQYNNYSYPNAHLTQVEIEEITRRDQEKFENEKEKKIDKEIGSLRLRQKNETDALELKISIHLNKFNRERSMKTDEIMLKYKHKTKGLETYQKAEREEYERIINQDTQRNTSMIYY